MTGRPAKSCAACGRRIEWRRKWERHWDQVRYCSAACRRHGVDDTDRRLERTIFELLDARAAAWPDPDPPNPLTAISRASAVGLDPPPAITGPRYQRWPTCGATSSS